ncbi:phage protein [Roseibium sp. TrichSKD4]|uniref:phage protein Gp27 family protein n=1 Tax=Roseibium sp. TrichSKD4 TaxID=744980 RepID=UPI0001E5760B|nr:phage protein Gp27 family protein [Roseibium sp. TrichSKD4]EFO30946.1 phage protein [Roseibium sp. TrichSKD4]
MATPAQGDIDASGEIETTKRFRRRSARGRLTKIDLLPEDADDIVAWAAEEMAAHKRHLTDIHREFNERLEERDIEPVSYGVFNRYSIRLAKLSRELERTRAIAAAFTERLDPDEPDNTTILISNALKSAALTALEKGNLDAKDLKHLAETLRSANAAEKVSHTVRLARTDTGFKKGKKMIEAVGKELNLGANRIKELKTEFLGLPDNG